MNRSAFGCLDSPGTGWVPRPPARLEPLWWIARAAWVELLGFRFQYPIERVPETGSRTSLHYYVYSDRLFFDAMELDHNGVPLQRTRTHGTFYNPAYVAWYGLMVLEQSLRGRRDGLASFRAQIDWLLANAVRWTDGSIVWPFPVDVKEGQCRLKAPWPSAMIQGLALSALVRAHRLGWNRAAVMELCRGAVAVFRMSIDQGGVRSVDERGVLYEEYPAYPLPRVLDGFLFSLLGLYDLWVETGEPETRALLDEGLAGLASSIEDWNYQDRWTWYGSHGYLCPPHYHNLNRLLLAAVAAAAGHVSLTRYVERWDPAALSRFDRARLFVTFTHLKNRSRARVIRGMNPHD